MIATKFGHATLPSPLPAWGARGSRRYIRLAVEGSLRRLQTDWIDLYQLHTPDPETPIDETIAALDELVREGKVRYLGHSNLSGWQVAEAELVARELGAARFVSAQNEYNLLARGAEAEVLPAVRHFGLGFLPFFPLQNGLLTGKFRRDEQPADTRIMRQRRHLVEQRAVGRARSLPRLRRRARHHDARGDLRLAARAAGPRERDRGHHAPRADPPERRGRQRVAAERGEAAEISELFAGR